MLPIYSASQDVQLLVLAAMIGAGGAFATFAVYRHLLMSPGRHRTGWLALAGCCGAATLWAMCLVAILAVGTSPDPLLAVLSLAVAAIVLLAGYVVTLLDGRASRRNSARMNELVEVAVEGLIIADDGMIVNINTSALRLCGRGARELIGERVFGTLLAAPRRPASSSDEQHLFEVPLRCADGTSIPVEVVFRRMAGLARGNEVYAIRDLRERNDTAQQLAKANAELRRHEEELCLRNRVLDGALEHMSQGLCVYDKDKRVVICNAHFATMYDLAADAIQPGMSLGEVVQLRIDNGIYAGGSPAAYLTERTATFRGPQDSVQELSNGRVIAVARRPMPEGGWVTTHEDITEKQQMERQVTRLAHHDPVTDLPRRTVLCERLEKSLATASQEGFRLAVLALGIDGFGEVNDTLGHAIGDGVLKAVADRLQKSSRRSTILGRLGDDSFAVIEFVEHPGRDAAGLATRLLDEIRKPFQLGAASLDMTATIGIAASPADGRDADSLLKNAMIALNRGRLEGRGRYYFFEPGMDRDLRERRTLQQELAAAIENRQLVLHYQPIVDLTRNQIAGFEALLRWQHPRQGLMSPAGFLPIAEATGLSRSIGEWTLQEACTEAARWPKHLIVSVNLSVAQFWSPDLVPSIIKALAFSGLTADRLEIEITEKVIHADGEGALAILRRVCELGVHIALDDFGTGFSSLGYIRQFPLHKLKIDRSFVAGLSGREDSRVILRTLARLGAGFGLITTAEGVETKEQLDIVVAEGCTEMQGYYFSAPKTAEEIQKLLVTVSGGPNKAVA